MQLSSSATPPLPADLSSFGRTFGRPLRAVADDSGAIDGRRLGKWSAANQNRILDGMKIITDGVVADITRWRLASHEVTSAWKAMTDDGYRDVQTLDHPSA
jgi:hypothetical protein